MEENQQPKTGKFALNYGLLTGGAMLVFSIMIYVMDMLYSGSKAINLIGAAILIIGIIVAIIQFKKHNAGFLSLSQSLKVGLGVALISALISVVYMLVLINVMEPDFTDKMGEMTRATLTEQGKFTQEQIDQQLGMQKKFFWITYPAIIIFNLFIGFVIALIVGLALKKAKPNQ